MEKTLTKKRFDTKKMVLLAMFTAMAYIMMFVVRIPVVAFLKYEPKDVIIAIAGFIYGPIYSVGISFVVSLVEMITVSDTGTIGALMNFVSTVSFAGTAALIYHKKRTMWGAIAGLFCGTFVMTACMLLWNYIITPVYMKTPREVVAGMLLPVFLPFNMIKAVLNTAFTLMLYKPLTMILRKTHVLPESGSKHAVKKLDTALVYVFAALLVGTSILAILVVSGKINF